MVDVLCYQRGDDEKEEEEEEMVKLKNWPLIKRAWWEPVNRFLVQVNHSFAGQEWS